MLMLWTCSSSKNFYKTVESANSYSEEIEHEGNYLSRRHLNSWVLSGGNSTDQGHSNISSPTTRFCDKLEKVCFGASPELSISGPVSELREIDFVNNSRKSDESEGKMLLHDKKEMDKNPRIDKTNRVAFFDLSSGNASKTAAEISPEVANTITKNIKKLPNKAKDNQSSHSGVEVVVRKSHHLQREVSDINSQSDSASNRFVEERLEDVLPGGKIR